MSNTEGSDGKDMGNGVRKATTLDPVVVVEGKERMWAHTQHGMQIKRLRSDCGGEYTGGEFTKFLKEQGTKCQLTTHDTPQHNGVAESLNCHLVEHMCAVLHQSGLPKTLWAEVLHFVIWVKNRTLTRTLGNVTPFEKLTRKKPNIGVPEWGQCVWVHTAANSKLDAHMATAHWVGYNRDSTHTHRIYWTEQHKVSVERDVKFTALSTTVSIPTPIPTPPSAPAPVTLSGAPSIAPECQQPPAATNSGEEEVEVEDELVDATPPPEPAQQPCKSKSGQATQPTHQSSRIHKPSQYAKRLISREGTADGTEHRPPGWYVDYATNFASVTRLLPDCDSPNTLGAYHMDIEEAAAVAVQAAGRDPKSLREVQSRSDWPSWKEAMDCELSTLKQAGMWETVPHPKDKNVIDCKWVYRTKYKSDGAIDKHKARLVA